MRRYTALSVSVVALSVALIALSGCDQMPWQGDSATGVIENPAEGEINDAALQQGEDQAAASAVDSEEDSAAQETPYLTAYGDEAPLAYDMPEVMETNQDTVQNSGFAGAYLAARYASVQDTPNALAHYGFKAFNAANTEKSRQRLIAQTFPAALISGEYSLAVELAKNIEAMEDVDSPVAQILNIADRIKSKDYETAKTLITNMPQQRLTASIAPVIDAWLTAELSDAATAAKQLDNTKVPYGMDHIWAVHRGALHMLAGQSKTASLIFSQYFSKDVSLKNALLAMQVLRDAGQDSAAKQIADALDVGIGDLGISEKLRIALKNDTELYPLPQTPSEGVAELLSDLSSSLSMDRSSDRFALSLLRIGLYLSPDNPFLKFQLAESKLDSEMYDEAINIYRSLVDTPLLRETALLQAARAAVVTENQDLATSLVDELAKTTDLTAFIQMEIAGLYRGLERCEDALPYYDRIIPELEAESLRDEILAELLFSRGTCLDQMGQWPKAEADLQAALALTPEQPYILNYLGYTWADRGENIDTALLYIQKAIEQRPQDGFIVDSLGWVYYKIGELDKALEQLELAVQLEPNDPTINDHLGDLYWHLGRKNEARFQWQRVLSLDESQDREHAEARARAAAKLDGDLGQIAPFTPRIAEDKAQDTADKSQDEDNASDNDAQD